MEIFEKCVELQKWLVMAGWTCSVPEETCFDYTYGFYAENFGQYFHVLIDGIGYIIYRMETVQDI